ncbi:MAG: hypothetical protein Q8936_21515 [Bacillota bacterium]|nr:hypothetical protein [Bacillota bacterium]
MLSFGLTMLLSFSSMVWLKPSSDETLVDELLQPVRDNNNRAAT